MAHRLKEIREKQLDLSLEKFAEIVGEKTGKQEKWYFQRVARIESGKTRLNDQMIEDICEAFPQISPWHLFADPEDVYPEAHRAIVQAYLNLSPPEQELLDKLMFQGRAPLQPADTIQDPYEVTLHDEGGKREAHTLTDEQLKKLRQRLREGTL